MKVLQDWVCIQGSNTTPRVQPSRDWLELASFSDATVWLEVRSVSNPFGGNVVLTYETGPTLDDSQFRNVATISLSTTTTALVTKFRLADDPSVPVGRWLRWKLTGTTSAEWSVTFRILAVGGRAITLNSFDAASLQLTGWWRGSSAGSPWAGSPSTGSSGLRNLTEATNPPSAGTAVNGFAPADFDGTNDLMNVSGLTTRNLVSASAGSVAALVNIDAINTSVAIGGLIWQNDGIISDNGAYWGLMLGGASSNQAQGYVYDGAFSAAGVTITLATWQFLQMRWDGTRVEMRLNNGSWNTATAGSMQSTANGLRVGVNADTRFFDGRLLELMTADRYVGENDFDRIRGYVNARYALSI